MKIDFILNGIHTERDAAPDTTLLQLLRDCGVHSVRQGCDTSNCGICTVWVEDKPILSCSLPAPRVIGKKVTTIEGVRRDAEELLSLMAEEGADQCGFCAPGYLMTVLAMLRELPHPTEDEIRQYLSGNLCRCTGYNSQMRVLRKVYEKRRGK